MTVKEENESKGMKVEGNKLRLDILTRSTSNPLRSNI